MAMLNNQMVIDVGLIYIFIGINLNICVGFTSINIPSISIY